MKTFGVIAMFIVMMCGNIFAQSERSYIRDGNRSYKEQKFTDAEVDYRKALEKNKELHEGTFNLGDALYKQDRYDEAAEQYRIAASKDADNATKAKAYYNLGNSLLKAQKFPESIGAYKESLKLNPNDADTKYNLEYAKTLLMRNQQNKSQNGEQKKVEPSPYAKKLKKQADDLVAQHQYFKAWIYMNEGMQRDKTVIAYQDYIGRLKKVSEAVEGR